MAPPPCECRRKRADEGAFAARRGFVTLRPTRWRPASTQAMGAHGSNRFPNPSSLVDQPLARDAEVKLDPQQTNYLMNVLRFDSGARVLLFNGRDGEFSASLAAGSRKAALLVVGARTRAQEAPPDVDYLFAPLKHARLDYMAQKAVEMGARRLRPVITRHTQVARVNLERLRLNAIEACEQCGVIWTPEIAPVEPLAETLSAGRPSGCSCSATRRRRWRARSMRSPARAGTAVSASLWARRRLRRGGARGDPVPAPRRSPQPRAANPARGHSLCGGAGAHPGHTRRLAEKAYWGRAAALTSWGRRPPFSRHDVVSSRPAITYHSMGASRKIARTIAAAAGGLLSAIIAGPLHASAAGVAPGLEPPLRGSYVRDRIRIWRRQPEPDARGSAATSQRARVSGLTSRSAVARTSSRRWMIRVSPAAAFPASRL